MVIPIKNTESLAFGIANANTLAARPNFELAFNVLQNTVISRLNKEIEKLNNEPVNNVDAFLLLEQKRLSRVLPFVQTYQANNDSNRFRAASILDKLDILDLDVLLADSTHFDATLAEANQFASEFLPVDGSAIGIFALDGFEQIARDGLGINAYASYADDAARLAAINSARTRVQAALDIANINAETAFDFRQRTESKIIKLDAQISATRAANRAEKVAEIEKLRQQYAQTLNAISLAFEVAQARSEALGKNLLANRTPKPGTILRLFV